MKTLWPWNCNDHKTWKYSGYKIVFNHETQEQEFIWIKNPEFAYKHLDPETRGQNATA